LSPCPGLPRTRCACQSFRCRSTLTPRPPWIEALPVGPRRRNFAGNQEERSLYNVFFTELKYLNSFIAKLNRTRDKLSIFGLRENALFPLLGLIASERRNSGKKKLYFLLAPSNTFQKTFGRTTSVPGLPPCHGLPRARCACRAAAPSLPGHPSRTNPSFRTPSRGATVANFRYKRAQMNPLHCVFVGIEKFHLLQVQNPERVLQFCRFSVCEKSTFSTLKLNSYKTKKVWRKRFALLTSSIKYLSENVW